MLRFMNMRRSGVRIQRNKLPSTPGVYLMKDVAGKLLYVGKAGNLKRRVESYFSRPHDLRIQKLVSEIRWIDYEKTDTAIEALIREAELIKRFEPPYNVREKDDKSFLYVTITKEQFPRVLLVRGKGLEPEKKVPAPSLTEHPTSRPARKSVGRSARFSARFGPFTSAANIRQALRIIRRIFPWSEHSPSQLFDSQKVGRTRPCFNYQIGLCPGTCIGAISPREYRNNIANLKLFFAGKKKRVVISLTRDMRATSKKLEFEQAEKLRRQIFALQHIQDVALITDDREQFAVGSDTRATRIEGYDISNISGDSAVGSMVVFTNNHPDKDEYRKFKIKTVEGANDVAMLREVLLRRFRHRPPAGGWRLPDLILVDGGAPQVGAALSALRSLHLAIPIVGIAKGPERKRNDIIGLVPLGFAKDTLIRVRDEAHRFAIRYHKHVRKRKFLSAS